MSLWEPLSSPVIANVVDEKMLLVLYKKIGKGMTGLSGAYLLASDQKLNGTWLSVLSLKNTECCNTQLDVGGYPRSTHSLASF